MLVLSVSALLCVYVLYRVLRVKSEEVKRLTPRIIEQAQQVAAYPERRKVVGQLDDTTHQWVGHVGQLIDATQQANLPWSKTAERLADAAKAGIGVQTQVRRNPCISVSV